MLEPHAFDSQCDMAALVYGADEDPDALLNGFAANLIAQGVRVVGLIQGGRRVGRAPQLSAVVVHSSEDLKLFQDLDAHANACRLDVDALARAGQEISAAIDRGADLLIINRFGRQERQGRGLLYLIDQALSADIPVLVAVPGYCFEAWVKFANGMSVKIPPARGSLQAWWRKVSASSPGVPALTQATFCEAFK